MCYCVIKKKKETNKQILFIVIITIIIIIIVIIIIAVWLERLRASVSAPAFQIQHAIFQTDELHPPANERPPFGLT